jgi:hypothetical protein
MRDSHRNVIKLLQRFEKIAPKFAVAAVAASMMRDPFALPTIIGAISTYDGIVAARGTGSGNQDVWMALTAAIGGVTTSWYDTSMAAWTPGSVPSITAYTNAATGGAVMDAASNGSWMKNPGGTNKKYIVSCGLSVSSITGFSLAMLYDMLWAGSYSVASNATINPSTDVAVTRYTGTESVGNMMQLQCSVNYTATTGVTLTTTYTDQAGTTGKTTISLLGTTATNTPRIQGNTLHNATTVVACTPFMPLTNAGSSGVRSLEQIVTSVGATVTGSVNHKIVRPLIIMPFIAAGSYIEQDTTLNIGNMVELVNVSQVCGCLHWNVFTGGTGTATMSAMIRTAEG